MVCGAIDSFVNLTATDLTPRNFLERLSSIYSSSWLQEYASRVRKITIDSSLRISDFRTRVVHGIFWDQVCVSSPSASVAAQRRLEA